MPKVSVLMAVYNTKEEYLRAAIDSILSQTFKDFELILLDDASPDRNVEKVIKSYSDKRIRYVCNEKNLGISLTRNRLIDLAKGEYLAVMDHDDISLPERFEKEVQYLDEHPDIGVVSCFYKKFPVNGRVPEYFVDDNEIKIQLVQSCAIMHPASMIRKSVLDEHNIRYENEFTPAEDYALWCRLIPFTKFHNIPEVLFHYRVHTTNTSKVQSLKMQRAMIAIREFVKAENPVLVKQADTVLVKETDVKLFGCIPFIRKQTQNDKTKWFLFGKIMICSVKHRKF